MESHPEYTRSEEQWLQCSVILLSPYPESMSEDDCTYVNSIGSDFSVNHAG